MTTTSPKPTLNQLQVFGAEYNAGNSGTSISIDWANGFNQKVTLTGSPTITLGTPAMSGRYQLRLIQNGANAYTVTWAGSAYSAGRWIGSASAPAVNITSAGETIVSFFFDGTNFIQQLGTVGS